MNNWQPDELEIFQAFHQKCVKCGRTAAVLHEIVPKSRTKNWKAPGNRIPLCVACHDWVHYEGAGKVANYLYQMRDLRLEQYGRKIDSS